LFKGLIHVYTGNGKGKTTAALGLTIRAAGNGLKCCFIQFIKGKPSGEMFALKNFPQITFIQTGRKNYDFNPTEEDKTLAEKGLKLAVDLAPRFDLMVLDEINVAVHLKLLKTQDVVSFIKNKPENLELVLTGRHAPAEFIKLADYVTHFELIKHPYYKNIKARKGIDY
jgi:cob(I)alamin adenosyltransferase